MNKKIKKNYKLKTSTMMNMDWMRNTDFIVENI